MALSVVVGLALGLWRLDGLSLYYDELFVTSLQGMTLDHGLRVLWGTAFDDQHPPLYYLLALTWSGWLGTTAWGVRSLSAVCAAATLPAVYALGASLGRRRAGALGAVLLSVLPVHVYYAREARMYALLALLSTASTAALVSLGGAGTARRRGRLALYLALASATVMTHYFGAITVAAQACAVALRGARGRAAWFQWTAVFSVPAAVFAPCAVLAAWQFTHRDHAYLPFDGRALADLVAAMGGSLPRASRVQALPLLALACLGLVRAQTPPAATHLPPLAWWGARGRRVLRGLSMGALGAAVAVWLTRATVAHGVTVLRVACGEQGALAVEQGRLAAGAVWVGMVAAAVSLGLLALACPVSPVTPATEQTDRWLWPDPLLTLSHLAFVLMAFPLGLTLVAGMAGVPLLHVHNFIAAAPLVALLAGAGLDALPVRSAVMVTAGLVIASLALDARLGAVPGLSPRGQRALLDHTYADWRSLSRWIPDDSPLPVVTVETFATDAVMHYQRARDVIRLRGVQDAVHVGQIQRSLHGTHPTWAADQAFHPTPGEAFWWVQPRLAHPGVTALTHRVSTAVDAVAHCTHTGDLPLDAAVFQCVAR